MKLKVTKTSVRVFTVPQKFLKQLKELGFSPAGEGVYECTDKKLMYGRNSGADREVVDISDGSAYISFFSKGECFDSVEYDFNTFIAASNGGYAAKYSLCDLNRADSVTKVKIEKVV